MHCWQHLLLQKRKKPSSNAPLVLSIYRRYLIFPTWNRLTSLKQLRFLRMDYWKSKLLLLPTVIKRESNRNFVSTVRCVLLWAWQFFCHWHNCSDAFIKTQRENSVPANRSCRSGCIRPTTAGKLRPTVSLLATVCSLRAGQCQWQLESAFRLHHAWRLFQHFPRHTSTLRYVLLLRGPLCNCV